MKICSLWSTENVQWKNAKWTWAECELVEEIVNIRPGVDAATLVPPWLEEPWNPYRAGEIDKNKRKKLIKLICRVKGQEYSEEKKPGDFKLTVEDIKVVVKAVANIDLDVKLEK
jgi:hypothetical protein